MNPFIGVLFHWLGGLASGSFYVPYRGVRKWSWETYWLAGGGFSWIVCPLFFALLMTDAPRAASLHCWQGDEVRGFENCASEPGAGLAATGNHPGCA